MMPATDSVRLGPPMTGVPRCQEVSVADLGAGGAERMPMSERRRRPASREAIPATTLVDVVALRARANIRSLP
jgi:hypothetical protein